MLSYSGILRIFHLKKTIGYTIIRVFLIQIFMLVKNYKEKCHEGYMENGKYALPDSCCAHIYQRN